MVAHAWNSTTWEANAGVSEIKSSLNSLVGLCQMDEKCSLIEFGL